MSETGEPRRLLDDPSTGEALRVALEAGREELPSDGELASLAARLGPFLGPGAGGGGGMPVDPSPVAAGAGGLAAKAIGFLAAAAVMGGVAYWATSDPRVEPAPSDEQPAPAPREAALEAPSLPEGVDVPEDLAIAPEPLRPRDRPSAPAPPAAEIDPEAELVLVRSAQDALRTSPARALALTDEHRRRFGEGTLEQEREVVAIDALARLGRESDARARAEAFHRRFPRSAHGRRVDVIVPPAP